MMNKHYYAMGNVAKTFFRVMAFAALNVLCLIALVTFAVYAIDATRLWTIDNYFVKVAGVTILVLGAMATIGLCFKGDYVDALNEYDKKVSQAKD